MYDGTLEALGETVQAEEPITETINRGLVEEMGLDPSISRVVYGAEGAITLQTRPTDNYVVLSPYVFVQTLAGPQPWVGLGFVILVPPETGIIVGQDGEVGDARWWPVAELLTKLKHERGSFMGFHYPVFLQVCQDLQRQSALRKAFDLRGH